MGIASEIAGTKSKTKETQKEREEKERQEKAERVLKWAIPTGIGLLLLLLLVVNPAAFFQLIVILLVCIGMLIALAIFAIWLIWDIAKGIISSIIGHPQQKVIPRVEVIPIEPEEELWPPVSSSAKRPGESIEQAVARFKREEQEQIQQLKEKTYRDRYNPDFNEADASERMRAGVEQIQRETREKIADLLEQE